MVPVYISMDTATQSSIEEFYKQKAKFEEALKKKRRKLRADRSLTAGMLEEKLRALDEGREYRREGTRLVSVCGTAKRCPGPISVDRGTYTNIRANAASLQSATTDLENATIRAKLDYLFGYTSQTETLQRFETLKPRLEATSAELENARMEYWRIATRAATAPELKETEARMRVEVGKLQAIMAEGQTDGPARAASVYVDSVAPLATKVRALKYKSSEVVPAADNLGYGPEASACMSGGAGTCDDLLIQSPYTLSSLIVPSGSQA